MSESAGTLQIVCIEDDPEMIDLIALMLNGSQFRVHGAPGGRPGLELAARVRPALVLLDLMMPDMDGWEVYHHLRADEALKDIPVIVITARAKSIDKVLGLHIAKVDDYITKPFSPAELQASVLRVLEAAGISATGAAGPEARRD
jgi:DNA-binding response OmpR family regulator